MFIFLFRYRIEPNEDGTKEFHLFSNGSVKLSLNDTQEHMPHQYCLESFLLDDGTTRVLPLFCFTPEEPPTKNRIVLICNLQQCSSFFLVRINDNHKLLSSVGYYSYNNVFSFFLHRLIIFFFIIQFVIWQNKFDFFKFKIFRVDLSSRTMF